MGTTDAVDLFAGPGGWDLGARWIGLDTIGLEADPDACSTRIAAGLPTIRTDVAAYPWRNLAPVQGLIASPPCTAFSSAGGGRGRPLLDELAAAILERSWFWGRDWTAGGDANSPDHPPEVWLPVETARWVVESNPFWVALEQVPPALPLWHAIAQVLGESGYRTWVGVVNAADYGVPQTRKRAVLLASRLGHDLDGPPPPTHAKDGAGGLLPWVSMGDALGWTDGRVGFPRRDDRGDSPDGYRERDFRSVDQPAFTVTETGAAVVVEVNTGRDWKPGEDRSTAQTIPDTEPAPTLTGKSGGQWHLQPGRNPSGDDLTGNRRPRDLDEPAPTVAFGNDAAAWCWERPATAVMGDSRIWPPGHKVNADDIARLGEDEARERYGDRAGTDAIRLEPAEALVLQSFPADWPLRGSRTSQFGQVGNAVPPRLAAHLLSHITGRTFRPEQKGTNS